MLPGPVERIVQEIASDTTSGALPLALRAVEAYGGLKGNREPRVAADALHNRLQAAQPWMAAVVNASALANGLAGASEWGKLDALRERLGQARLRVASASTSVLGEARTIMTISYSSDVLEALHALRAVSPSVYVCESRPLREGVALAKALRRDGIEATLLADAAGPGLVERCEAVVTGVDSLLRSGFLVNKIGTIGLALACEEFGVPYYGLMELIKVELEGQEIEWREESRDPREISDEVQVLNFYFERIPARLARSVVTEAGPLTVKEALGNYRHMEDLAALYSLD